MMGKDCGDSPEIGEKKMGEEALISSRISFSESLESPEMESNKKTVASNEVQNENPNGLKENSGSIAVSSSESPGTPTRPYLDDVGEKKIVNGSNETLRTDTMTRSQSNSDETTNDSHLSNRFVDTVSPAGPPSPYHSLETNSTQSPSIQTPQKSNLDDILGPNGGSIETAQSDLDDILGPHANGRRSNDPPNVPTSGQVVTSLSSQATEYSSEYVHFRDSDKESHKPNSNDPRPVPIQANIQPSTHSRNSPIQQHNIIDFQCARAETPQGDPSTRTNRNTPSANKRAINSIAQALEGRGNVDSYGWSPRQTSVILEAQSGEDFSAVHTDFTSVIPLGNKTPGREEIDSYAWSPRPTSDIPKVQTIDDSTAFNTELRSTIDQGEGITTMESGTKEWGLKSLSDQYQSRMSVSTDLEQPASTWESLGRQYTSASTYGDTTTRGGDDSTLMNEALSPNNQSTTWDSSRFGTNLTRSEEVSTTDTSFLYRGSGKGSSSHEYHGASTFNPLSSDQSTGFSRTQTESEYENGSAGGPMWQAAEIEAQSSLDKPLGSRAKKFAETIATRTRSRADTDALLSNDSSVERPDRPPVRLIDVNSQEEELYIRNTSIARKRDRVVQLLIIGLLSFLISFLGGFFVLTSCNFALVTIDGGGNGKEYDLHFGLWKYTPLDSLYDEDSYCSQYDGDFSSGAPWAGRISSMGSVLCGGFSLLVLWLYLVLGKCVQNVWSIAILSAGISGFLQLSTLSMFFGPICREEACTLGPGAIVSIFAGLFYFVLAFEMKHNSPLVHLRSQSIQDIPSREEPHNMVANLEMNDFGSGAIAYVKRIVRGEANPYPTLNQVQRGASNHQRLGEGMMDRKSGAYRPPAVYV